MTDQRTTPAAIAAAFDAMHAEAFERAQGFAPFVSVPSDLLQRAIAALRATPARPAADAGAQCRCGHTLAMHDSERAFCRVNLGHEGECRCERFAPPAAPLSAGAREDAVTRLLMAACAMVDASNKASAGNHINNPYATSCRCDRCKAEKALYAERIELECAIAVLAADAPEVNDGE